MRSRFTCEEQKVKERQEIEKGETTKAKPAMVPVKEERVERVDLD